MGDSIITKVESNYIEGFVAVGATSDSPARASTIAAARPLGPAPMTIAS